MCKKNMLYNPVYMSASNQKERIMRLFVGIFLATLVFGAEPNRIVVDRFVPNEIALYIAKADGTDEKPLLQQPGGLDYNAAYSADGNWVAFTSERNGSADLY